MKINAQWTVVSSGRPAVDVGASVVLEFRVPSHTCLVIVTLLCSYISLYRLRDHSSNGDMWPQRPCRITTVASDVGCSVRGGTRALYVLG